MCFFFLLCLSLFLIPFFTIGLTELMVLIHSRSIVLFKIRRPKLGCTYLLPRDKGRHRYCMRDSSMDVDVQSTGLSVYRGQVVPTDGTSGPSRCTGLGTASSGELVVSFFFVAHIALRVRLREPLLPGAPDCAQGPLPTARFGWMGWSLV